MRLFLLLFSIAHADSSVGSPVCATLMVSRSRIAHSHDLQLSAAVSGHGTSRTSTVVISDASGRVVFTAPRAFMTEPALALDFSSSGGPTLPSLPPGDYRAQWLLDGARSNLAHFTVGEGAPPPLALEPIDAVRGCRSGRLLVSVYNPGPSTMDLFASYLASELIVDGRSHLRAMTLWAGFGNLRPGEGWSFVIHPSEYGVTATAGEIRLRLGNHTISAQRTPSRAD